MPALQISAAVHGDIATSDHMQPSIGGERRRLGVRLPCGGQPEVAPAVVEGAPILRLVQEARAGAARVGRRGE